MRAATNALNAAACALFWRRLAALGRPPHVRLGESMLLGVAVLVASLALFPDLASGAAEAWRWLGRDEAFQAAVGESKPLFFERGTFDVSLAELRLSRLVYLFPLALVAVALGPWRGPVGLVVVTWSGGLAAATLAQARFFNSFSVAMALVSAAGLVALWRLLPLRSAPSRVAAATLLGLAGLWLLAPSWGAYSRDVSNLRALVQGATLTVPPERRYWMALYETALWLRERTPSPGAAYAPGARPGYGVLGHWQTGHLVTYVAERPMVVGNFGDDLGEESARSFDLALDYFRAPESEAALILDSLGARYVLVRPLDVDRGESSPESIARQLGDSDAGGLSRHRLLYERPVLRAAGAEKPRSHFRIFERVRGAEIVGWAPPGSPVAATLPYTSPTGRKGSFRGEARADSSGRFRLRVAHSVMKIRI